MKKEQETNFRMGTKNKKLEVALKALDESDKDYLSPPEVTYKSTESFKDLFEQGSDQQQELKQWDVVQGQIVEKLKDYVVVDIGYKSEGLVAISEFRIGSDKDSSDIQIGSKVEVLVDNLEDENGMVVLSKQKADFLKVWDEIERVSEKQEVIEGRVLERVKGGLSVDIGVKAFLPGSQMDQAYMKNSKDIVGQTLKFKIIKFNKKRGNIVLSRKALSYTPMTGAGGGTFQELDTTLDVAQVKEGDNLKGRVKNITAYGVFIDLGKIDGLLHITDLSWKRLKHPSEVVHIGQDVEVKVLRVDHEKNRINLGLKQMQDDPWQEVVSKYVQGSKVKARVIRITDYGAFLELENGIEGLVHVTEMSWMKKHRKPEEILTVDQEVEVMILEVSSENRRISLSLKQLEDSPWVTLKEEIKPGDVIEGPVKALTDFGIFVGVRDGIEGLVHVSDFSWDKRVENPAEMYKVGDTVKAVVLSLDIGQEKLSLGVKQLSQDPWKDVANRFPIGHKCDVKITKVTSFGVFVELQPNIEGLIHVSELSTKRIENPEEQFEIGQSLTAEVVSLDTGFRKIGLSVKAIALREKQESIKEYMNSEEKSMGSLGDVMGEGVSEMLKNKSSEESNEE